MDTDFVMFFIFTPLMVVLGMIGYFVGVATLKKKKREREESERCERKRREKEGRERFCKYLDEHPAAKEAFKEEIRRECEYYEKHKPRLVCLGWNLSGYVWDNTSH